LSEDCETMMTFRIPGVLAAALAIMVSPGWGQKSDDGMTTSTFLEQLLERHTAYSGLFDMEGSVSFRMTRSMAVRQQAGGPATTESLTRLIEQSVAANTTLWDLSAVGDEVVPSDAPLMFSLIQFDWADNPILLDVMWSPRQAQFRRTDSVAEIELLRLGFPSMFTTIAAQRLESAAADGEASRVTVRK